MPLNSLPPVFHRLPERKAPLFPRCKPEDKAVARLTATRSGRNTPSDPEPLEFYRWLPDLPMTGYEEEEYSSDHPHRSLRRLLFSLHFSYPIASSEKQMGRVLCGCFRGCPGHGT